MPLALVTGTRPHLGPAATTLGRRGFEVITWEVGAPAPGREPVDCYLQLPCAGAATDLICRTDTLAAVAGRLRPTASILLAVADPGSQPVAVAADLLASIALALLEELGRPPGRLAVVPLAAFVPVDVPVLDLPQWEMPTPPLVSAP
jgi:hypothetical protein